jgi:hypothetical protein
MLRELLAVESLALRLIETAPKAVEVLGGAATLVELYGAPTGARFWSLRSLPEELWSAMAAEHQAPHRANMGE